MDEKATRVYCFSNRPRRDHLREASRTLMDYARRAIDRADTSKEKKRTERQFLGLKKVAAWLEEKADE